MKKLALAIVVVGALCSFTAPAGESFLRVTANSSGQPQSGCYVWNGTKWVWTDPCP